MDKELLTKQQIRENLDTWLEGFSNNTRFDNSINWEFSYSVQMPYTKDKRIHKNQQKIIGDNNV